MSTRDFLNEILLHKCNAEQMEVISNLSFIQSHLKSMQSTQAKVLRTEITYSFKNMQHAQGFRIPAQYFCVEYIREGIIDTRQKFYLSFLITQRRLFLQKMRLNKTVSKIRWNVAQ